MNDKLIDIHNQLLRMEASQLNFHLEMMNLLNKIKINTTIILKSVSK